MKNTYFKKVCIFHYFVKVLQITVFVHQLTSIRYISVLAVSVFHFASQCINSVTVT